jgi:methionine-rich copper-binding protein CopC
MKRIAPILVVVLAAWASLAAAQSSMHVMSSSPTVDQVMDGSATSFAIRFDRPVNHARSHLTLVTPQGERALQPRLEAEPNTLFTPIGRLEAGSYELRWEAVELGGAVSRGSIPFRVARP